MRLSPIIVDRREKLPPPEETVARLTALGASAMVGELPVGDFLWTVTPDSGRPWKVIVERKTVNDLLGSLPPSDRITRFIDETGGEAPAGDTVRVLLLEGAFAGTVGYALNGASAGGVGQTRSGSSADPRWTMESFDNLLASFQELGTVVIRSVDTAGSARRLVSFWDYSGREHKTLTEVVRPRVEGGYLSGPKKDAVRMLMCLPGVGEQRARALLAHFGSVRAALDAFTAGDAAAFKEVEGVGKGLVTGARGLLEKDFS